jgi:hypothetical protein
VKVSEALPQFEQQDKTESEMFADLVLVARNFKEIDIATLEDKVNNSANRILASDANKHMSPENARKCGMIRKRVCAEGY